MRAAKGMGRVFRRKGTSSWWVGYSVKGKEFRESSQSENRTDAVKLLRRRLEEAGKGRPASEAAKVTLRDLRALAEQDFKLNGRKSSSRLDASWKRLEGVFGADEKAISISAIRLAHYVTVRTEAGAAPGTIKLELAALKRAFAIARKSGTLLANETPSDWPTIRGGAPRQGFFEDGELDSVASHLPADEADLVRFLHSTGWRVSEALSLTWRNVDRKAKVIRIETSKSGDPKTLPYGTFPALAALIEHRREVSDVAQKERGAIVTRVFSRGGEPIRHLRRSWISACIAAGFGTIEKDEKGRIIKKKAFRLVHDLRRSFARNASRAGISESVTMALGGWKTASVFRRYRIVRESDLAEGLAKLAEASGNAPTAPKVSALKAASGE